MPRPRRADRRRVLLVAFAYAPGAGSEPGLGYNMATALARRYDVTVLTDQAWPGTPPDPGPGEDLPRVIRLAPAAWPRAVDPRASQRRWELYYYTWMRSLARRLPAIVESTGAELVQHVTYGRYWMPSAADTAGRPFVWGPVGGGESASPELLRSSLAAVRYPEYFRIAVRAAFERDPALARTGRAADLALAVTPESAERMRRLTGAPVEIYPAVSLDAAELRTLGALPAPPDGPVRFLALGRLLFWKGFDMAIDAFARVRDPRASFWIIGDGPERGLLEARAAAHGLGERIRFLGRLDRAETLGRFADGHVLVHPSLHDSGGMVCLEAMAARRPVICLEQNGPAFLCGGTGVTVPMVERERTVRGLTEAMERFADDRPWLRERGEAAARHVAAHYEVETRTDRLVAWYEALWEERAGRSAREREALRPPRAARRADRRVGSAGSEA